VDSGVDCDGVVLSESVVSLSSSLDSDADRAVVARFGLVESLLFSVVFAACDVLLSLPDVELADELLADPGPLASPVSATATPGRASAVPTPRNTASAPTRPMKRPYRAVDGSLPMSAIGPLQLGVCPRVCVGRSMRTPLQVCAREPRRMKFASGEVTHVTT
jgi:hypothetical protein